MSETIAQKLDEARALIEKGWCQKTFGKTATGRDVGWRAKTAICFCVSGALYRVAGRRIGNHAGEMLNLAIGRDRKAPLYKWNDSKGRTQAEVIEAFRKAAELARQS